MRHAFLAVLVGLLSCVAGIGSAWLVLQGPPRFSTVTLGQWQLWPKAGDSHADPYTKANLARNGIVWMGITEGLQLTASTDSDGHAFSAQCLYRLSGKVPRGRLWSLTAQADEAHQPHSFYITSTDVIWNDDETLDLAISTDVTSGNWLKAPGSKTFSLILRIYDTPLTSGALDAAIGVPRVMRETCQ